MAPMVVGTAACPRPTRAAANVTRPTSSPDATPDPGDTLRFGAEASGSDEEASARAGSTVDCRAKHIGEAGGADLNHADRRQRALAFRDGPPNERCRALMRTPSDREAEGAEIEGAQQGWPKLHGNPRGIIADTPGSTYYISDMFTRCELKPTAEQVVELGGRGEGLRR